MKLEKLISIVRLRLRVKSPFFATLAMFIDFKESEIIPTAATNGKYIWLNPEFIASLSPLQQDGLILHEILHAALLHTTRRKQRQPELWNIAADIVVNSIILLEDQTKFQLPPGGILPPQNWRDFGLTKAPDWDKLSVEEVYELLFKESNFINSCNWCENLADLLSPNQQPGENENSQDDEISNHEAENLKAHWHNALQQAAVIARTTNQGKLPAGLQRLIDEISNPQLDWRSYLWRYLVHTPNDFRGFDRRFVGRGLYLETLEGESVEVFVAVDTSGSIDNQQLSMFLGEIRGILGAYPHLKCTLYYADADIYGPYELDNRNAIIPQAEGGGGTSFIPFFETIETKRNLNLEGVCVYLTDGYGDFPQKVPSLPVLWVVTPGGLDLESFPFGETVRLIKQNF